MGIVMPSAPIPPPFERIEGRRFSFYPPILKIGSNEWTYRHATWSEILVRNAFTGTDLSIPRRFLGELSEVDHPVIIIGLLQELEYRNGAVSPHQRRVIEMPIAVGETPRPRRENAQLAPVIGIRLEPRGESRASRVAGGAVALGVLGCLAVVGYSLQGGEAHRRGIVSSLDQTYLALSGRDTYGTVVQALGVPEFDRWVTTPEGRRVHLLGYPDRGFRAALMIDGPSERYIGSISDQGRVLQSVLLPQGDTSSAILHDLEDF